jgi:uncharacterized protein YfaQ (DUF2300 family)
MTATNDRVVEPRALRLDSPLLKPEQAAELLAVRTSWITKPSAATACRACASAGTSASHARCSRSGYANGRRRGLVASALRGFACRRYPSRVRTRS